MRGGHVSAAVRRQVWPCAGPQPARAHSVVSALLPVALVVPLDLAGAGDPVVGDRDAVRPGHEVVSSPACTG